MGRSIQYLGKILQTEEIENGYKLKMENGAGRIQYYQPNILRVQLSNGQIEDGHSYAVVQKKEAGLALSRSQGNTIKISSQVFQTEINPLNACIRFSTPDGQIISEDGMPASWVGTELCCYKVLQEDEKFLGLGEKTGPLNRRGHAYTNWNTDKFGYAVDEDPLYLTAPFYIGIHSGLVYGIFFDNTYRTTFNFGASTERFSWFSADDGELNYYFIYGESVGEIIEHYSWLTGRMPLPPKWSLGFQQCRYSYYPEQEIYQLADTFRAKDIPCDVLYLDIHYMQDYKAFTFNQERFPNPKRMIEDIRQQGFKTAVILDPGIKVEEGYEPYDSGIEQDVFVKYPDEVRYIGEVWPGESHFPDFTAPRVRNWWGSLMPFYTDLGVKGFWNDMNEPAAWGQCLPNTIGFDYEGEGAVHRQARNVYGMQMSRSTAEGLKTNLPQERPFVLTRAGYSGIQRYSAVWTGDNVSSDEHLMLGTRLINSLGLTGIPYCGNDVGGFVGEASPELYARWISVGAFQPFFRAHSVVNSRDAEPWSFGEEVEQIARNYIKLRYQLLPYFYSLFHEASITGLPINRSLAFDYPHDERTYQYEHQFMLGDNLMIAAVESNKDFVKVWLPEGFWYNFWTGELIEGNQEIIVDCPIWKLPVFAKAGAILPTREAVPHLDGDYKVLHLHLYAGAENTFLFYQDDGISYEYQEGNFQLRKIELGLDVIRIDSALGDFQSKIKNIKLHFHGIMPDHVLFEGKQIELQTEDFRFLPPVESIDTFSKNQGEEMVNKGIKTLEIPYSQNEIRIQW
jgi:alpha-glucosidase